MITIAKKTGTAALAATMAFALTACGGHGAYSYLMPKDAVIDKLSGSKRSYDYIGGVKRSITAVSRNGDTINVRLSNASGPGSSGAVYCKIIVEAIDDEWSRATPQCAEKDDAFENTFSEINQMQVDEFVTAVLYDKPIDEAMVAKRTSAVAIGNINEMAEEASKTAASANRPARSTSSDWGSDTGSGSDWGSN